MFCMLIAVLGFDVVTIEYCRASQGEIALVLPFGIGEGMATLMGVRRARLQMPCGKAIIRPPVCGPWKFLWHFRPT